SDCCRACFFFFQAEDGIRDFHVTGVQTCALPIYGLAGLPLTLRHALEDERFTTQFDGLIDRFGFDDLADPDGSVVHDTLGHLNRSEERRVGKECRSRWAAYQYKKREEHR